MLQIDVERMGDGNQKMESGSSMYLWFFFLGKVRKEVNILKNCHIFIVLKCLFTQKYQKNAHEWNENRTTVLAPLGTGTEQFLIPKSTHSISTVFPSRSTLTERTQAFPVYQQEPSSLLSWITTSVISESDLWRCCCFCFCSSFLCLVTVKQTTYSENGKTGEKGESVNK